MNFLPQGKSAVITITENDGNYWTLTSFISTQNGNSNAVKKIRETKIFKGDFLNLLINVEFHNMMKELEDVTND